MEKIVESEGKLARKNGESIDDNPYYDKDTELAHHWEKGFLCTVTNGRPLNPPKPPVKPYG
ncbi:MAG: hypothetical protein OEX12_05805 [Gammaproteobacteria bacterium]|nr:hypothetical protein [Gammaproteobacteria bacterium]